MNLTTRSRFVLSRMLNSAAERPVSAMSGFLRDRRASSDNTLRNTGCRLQIFMFLFKAFLPAQAVKLSSVCRLFYTADSQAGRR